MTYKKQLEYIALTVGIDNIRWIPEDDKYWKGEHWLVETGDGGHFATADPLESLIELIYDILTEAK
jgi:hypothetical protein